MRYSRVRQLPTMLVGIVLALGIGSPAQADPTMPIDIRVGSGNAWAFVKAQDMATCEAVQLTSCYRFADGTVVAQVALLAPFSHLLAFLGIPLGGCTKVPSMGSSLDVVAVYAGTGDVLVAGSGPCQDLPGQLSNGTAFLVLPGLEQTIPPTDAWVADLASFRPTAAR
jgi:hypothetical protein